MGAYIPDLNQLRRGGVEYALNRCVLWRLAGVTFMVDRYEVFRLVHSCSIRLSRLLASSRAELLLRTIFKVLRSFLKLKFELAGLRARVELIHYGFNLLLLLNRNLSRRGNSENRRPILLHLFLHRLLRYPFPVLG